MFGFLISNMYCVIFSTISSFSLVLFLRSLRYLLLHFHLQHEFVSHVIEYGLCSLKYLQPLSRLFPLHIVSQLLVIRPTISLQYLHLDLVRLLLKWLSIARDTFCRVLINKKISTCSPTSYSAIFFFIRIPPPNQLLLV